MIVKARDHHAANSREALGSLCTTYWYPVYAFIRRRGFNSDQAQDYTQEFFTHLLEKDYLRDVDCSKGKFRSFLLAAVRHFLANRLEADRALKRGGGHRIVSLEMGSAEEFYRKEPAHGFTPEALFEYRWALTLLDRTLRRLRTRYSGPHFDHLKPFLLGEVERGQLAVVAERMRISEGALKVAVHRLRKRYRDALRTEIAETVADPSQVEEEIRYLLAVLARGTVPSPEV